MNLLQMLNVEKSLVLACCFNLDAISFSDFSADTTNTSTTDTCYTVLVFHSYGTNLNLWLYNHGNWTTVEKRNLRNSGELLPNLKLIILLH